MIIVFKKGSGENQIKRVIEKIRSLHLKPMVSKGVERTIIGVIGPEDKIRALPLERFPGVEKVMTVLAPYKLVSREFRRQDSIVDVGGIKIGGRKIAVMAGPCSVESKDLLLEIAVSVKRAGASILRGGAFKPRTSPYAFQGLGVEGLKYLKEASKKTGLKIVTEVMDTKDISVVAEYADMLQIGARNMQNFNLLKEAGTIKKPILLKRGMMSTVKEWLMSAEYLLANGNFDVVLCERGIRTFEDQTRFTLDLSAVPLVKSLSHLPVAVDPSHGTGKWGLIAPMSKAAVACGADALIIEVHPDPENAFSDGLQSILPDRFADMMKELKKVAAAVGREI